MRALSRIAGEEALQRVADEIAARHGTDVLAVQTDITVRSDCETLLKRTLDAFGALHVLVNNARRLHRGPGLPASGNSLPFWRSDAEIWRQTVDVNIFGTFLITQVIAPYLIEQGWGRIVNLTTSLDTMQGATIRLMASPRLLWRRRP